MKESSQSLSPKESFYAIFLCYGFYFLNRNYAAGLASFRDLFTWGKYPRVFVLEAEFSPRRYGSIIFAEKVIFPQILEILVNRWTMSCLITNL
jgi:hypothetical protein